MGKAAGPAVALGRGGRGGELGATRGGIVSFATVAEATGRVDAGAFPQLGDGPGAIRLSPHPVVGAVREDLFLQLL